MAGAGPVLVVGAAGKTGLAVTKALARRGVAVRAAVHRESSEAAVKRAGASEVSVLDLATGAGIDAGLAGASAVYHLAPNLHPDEVGIAGRVVSAAERAGVRRLVFHSVLHPLDPSMPHHLRKAEAEMLVRNASDAWTVLQPAAYLQNLLGAALAGTLEVPYSLEARFTNVDLADVADAAAIVLTEPGHEFATYELAGPQVMSVREMADVARQVLGRHVSASFVDAAVRVPAPPADLLAMFRAYDERGLVGNPRVLRMLLGRDPHTWAAVVARG